MEGLRKMGTISFFCTRCRRLTTFPASRRGSIVYCPRCQQALIAPDIPATDDAGEEEENNGGAQDGAKDAARFWGEIGQTAVGEEKSEEEGAEFDAPRRRIGATIASHLTPGKERPENWRRVETPEINGEIDAASLLTRTEVSDAEFLRRLRPDAASQNVASPPVAPPVLWGEGEARESANVGRIPKFVGAAVGAAALGGALAVGVFWADNGRKDGVVGANVDKQRVVKDGVFVEGALTFRNASGENAPDEGAFVFLFPNDERFDAPIALGDVSPQRFTSQSFENVVADLEARGARFAVADFEGRFAFDELAPGEYRVLLVSRSVGDDWRNANVAALKEIERFVVSPRLLLGQSRFFWTTRRFDAESATFEKSFGKAGAPFSNVE